MPPSGSSTADAAWVAAALRCVAAALHSGSAKVQWNACYAAGQALRSERLRGYTEAAEQVPGVLEGLLQVLSSSANYKSRTHAAAALGGLSTESVSDEQLGKALAVLVRAVDAVGGRTPTHRADAESGTRTANGRDAQAGSSSAAYGCDAGLSSTQRADVAFSELRYRAGLMTQMQQSLEHLQALSLQRCRQES